MTFQLRDYQHAAIHGDDRHSGILRAWQSSQRVLVQMPTGTGKTVVFLALAEHLLTLPDFRRLLILVDQRHLVDQPLEKMEAFFPDLLLHTGVEQAARHANGHRIVVATWQTITRRLDKYTLPGCDFSHIIVDEAHCNLDQQIKISNAFPDALWAGFSATPLRGDGRSLAELYAKTPAYRLLLPEAIRNGYLVPFTADEAMLPIRLEDADGRPINRVGDGWDKNEVGKLLRADNVMEVVLAKWRERAAGRTTLFYCAGVEDAAALCAYFNSHGVPSVFVSGETSASERARAVAALESGEALCGMNCQVYVKGFDLPRTSAIFVVRPTRSATALMQMMGRGLRTHDGKDDCIIVSFAPLGAKDIVMAADLLDPSLRRAIAAATAGEDEERESISVGIGRDGGMFTVDPNRVLLRTVELLGASGLAWYNRPGKPMWCAAVNTDTTLAIVLPDPARLQRAVSLMASGDWGEREETTLAFVESVRLYRVDKRSAGFLGAFDDVDAAKKRADEVAREIGVDATLAARTRAWRKLPVTSGGYVDGKRKWGQRDMLRDAGIDPSEARDRGHAAQLITWAKAWKAVEEADKVRLRAAIGAL